MLISDKFVIGHIPKTGGHVLATALNKLNINVYENPYSVDNDKATSTEINKHQTFDIVDPKLLKGKDLILVFRKLPAWFYSVMWHYSVHTRVNDKHRLTKTGIGRTYTDDFKQKKPVFNAPKLMAYSTYPDVILKKHMTGLKFEQIIWLRMENLEKDLMKYLNITEPINMRWDHSYTAFNEYLRWYNYWNDETRKILYENNPLWTSIQQKLYYKHKLNPAHDI